MHISYQILSIDVLYIQIIFLKNVSFSRLKFLKYRSFRLGVKNYDIDRKKKTFNFELFQMFNSQVYFCFSYPMVIQIGNEKLCYKCK
jgi:hypothetical protein